MLDVIKAAALPTLGFKQKGISWGVVFWHTTKTKKKNQEAHKSKSKTRDKGSFFFQRSLQTYGPFAEDGRTASLRAAACLDYWCVVVFCPWLFDRLVYPSTGGVGFGCWLFENWAGGSPTSFFFQVSRKGLLALEILVFEA